MRERAVRMVQETIAESGKRQGSVRNYLARAKRAGLSWQLPEQLDGAVAHVFVSVLGASGYLCAEAMLGSPTAESSSSFGPRGLRHPPPDSNSIGVRPRRLLRSLRAPGEARDWHQRDTASGSHRV